jgi:hypothetical protein
MTTIEERETEMKRGEEVKLPIEAAAGSGE